jgi:hypothetical protein
MAPKPQWWVTWQNLPDGTAARKSALIWGPQAKAPAQRAGWFEAGPFPTAAAAQAYKNAIGTGSVLPPPGTPIVGSVQAPANPFAGLIEIGHWIGKLVTALTDPHMWISLGWLLLGLILVIFAVWTLGRNEGVIPNAVPVPVPV